MIKNYFITAFRTLKKNKGFTAINVLGLSVGLAICLLIAFYVKDELSFDRYNQKAGRVYRVNEDLKFGGNLGLNAVSPSPFSQLLKSDFPEVEETVRMQGGHSFYVKKGNENVKEDKVVFADPSVFSVFTLPFTEGDPKTALVEPRSVVIDETVAEKYFGTTKNLVDKTLTVDDTVLYKITGVIHRVPDQSHFNFNMFVSSSTLDLKRENSWIRSNFNVYVLLKPGSDPQKLQAKFPSLIEKNAAPELKSVLNLSFEDFEKAGNYFRLSLQPLKDIHLKSNRNGELGPNGNIQYVYIFSAIGIFILLIACVNFMNLSTARSSNRAREVGIRKVLGSNRLNLVVQFLAESFLVTLVATLIAVFMAFALLSLFNQLAGKQLVVTSQLVFSALPAVLFIVVVIGLLAGAYPAFFLSGFQPISVLKGKLSAGFKNSWLRSSLVVFQFFISILLIIGTLVIYNQLKYMQNKDLGYNRSQVLVLQNVDQLGGGTKSFKNEVKQLPGVIDASLSGFLPTGGLRGSTTLFNSPTIDQKNATLLQFWHVDENYVNTLGMKIVAGRNLSGAMLSDSSAILVNETAAKLMGFTDPVNQFVYTLPGKQKQSDKLHIVGVVKDFNFSSLRENILPVAMRLRDNDGALIIRMQTANIPALMAQIQNKWKSFSPKQQMSFSFMDDDFDALYRSEQRMGKLFITFSTLAILIACLGLFGLAAYAAEQRIKEIGIRKVLGATVSGIVSMLSMDFIKLVFVSILVASPIAWYFSNQWLQGYAYRIDIQWWIFAIAGAIALFIAFVTISSQSIKAATSNPVDSLKNE